MFCYLKWCNKLSHLYQNNMSWPYVNLGLIYGICTTDVGRHTATEQHAQFSGPAGAV